MAEIKQGILGEVKGTVGTVVGSNWRGKNVIRSKPRKSPKIATASQLNQRSKFKLVGNFLRPLYKLTSKYFGSYEDVKSRSNLAMSYHLKNAIKNVEGEFVIDYSKVIWTKGILNIVSMPKVERMANVITISWSDAVSNALSKASDQVIAVVYNPEEDRFILTDGVTKRGDKKQDVALADTWTKPNNELWLVVVNAEECCTSMYLGTI